MTENQTTHNAKDDAIVSAALIAIAGNPARNSLFTGYSGSLGWQSEAKASKARAKRKRLKNAKRKQR